MLQRIRDNASGPLAYAVVGLISLVFGVWGIGSYFTPSANPEVANIGDVQITRYQLQQAYNQRYQRLRQIMGERFDADTFEPQQLRRAVLQQLIQSAVMDQYALSSGYRTTDQALLQVLTSDSRFQVNGKFSTQRYKAILANAGLTPAAYEARLRRNVVTTQVRAGIANGTFAAPPEVKRAYSLLKQQRDVAYALFPASAYAAQVKIGDSDVQAWYDAHKDQYMRPERVKLAYVELNREALQPQQTPTQDELRDLYEQNKGRFSTPDTRTGKQIFVPATEADSAQARQTIQSVATKLKQGQSFDDVASKAAASVKVTKLDAVSQAQLGADLGAALFSTKIGEVSAPVRTAKGWYLLKPTAETKGETQPFASATVQKQLQQLALTQWRNQRFGDLAERMETLAFQAPNSLDTLSQELDLKVQESGWISRTAGAGLGQSDVVRKAAFSTAVLGKRLNSTALQVGKDRRVVVRVADHQAPEQQPLDEVRDQVRQQLKKDKAAQLARQAAQDARQKLADGSDDSASLQSIAAANGAKFSDPGYIERTAKGVPPAIRQAVFGMSTAADKAPAYDVVTVANGDSALITLRDVKTDVVPKDGNIPAVFAQRQRVYLAQLEYAAFASYLNQHAEVELNKQNLDFQQ